ncbi:MAG: TolC family protein [Balneolaceae bacterium]|nr:TolC family protein [Balneolaceae bacterium]
MRQLSKAFTWWLVILMYLVGSQANGQNSAANSATNSTVLSLEEFIQQGLESTSTVDVLQKDVALSQWEVRNARSQRILPRIQLETQHGLVPGVESSSFPDGQLYLDPYLDNDWENWALFTRAQIEAIQPLFTWGAIPSAIEAATFNAERVEYETDVKSASFEVQLAEIYIGMQLSNALERVSDEADELISEANEEIRKQLEEGTEELTESDYFEFEVFELEYEGQRAQIKAVAAQMDRLWSLALDGRPADATDFMDVEGVTLPPFSELLALAFEQRAELKAVQAGQQALEAGKRATLAERYPTIYLGLSASGAITPNRPKQDNPFINNSTNFASARFGIGISQNLNLQSIRLKGDRFSIQEDKLVETEQLLRQQIQLDVVQRLQEAETALAQLQSLLGALVKTKEWVRHEQLNMDYGFGDVKNLVDALKKELELEASVLRAKYDWQMARVRLNHALGIPLSTTY